MSYAQERRDKEAERHAGEQAIKDRILAQIRSRMLEEDESAQRSPAEKSYRKGWNEGIESLARWLETGR